MSFYLKDPDARIDYEIDWTLDPDIQTIVDSIWSVTPEEAGGIEVEQSSFDIGQTSARIAGGIEGHGYTISNLVSLSDGSAEVRSISLRVEER
jgi:hypothetical protein